MAVIFELIVNFGEDRAAADAARSVVSSHPALTVGERRIALHRPLISRTSSYYGNEYLEMAVLPVGVAWGAPIDRGHPEVRLTAAELSELGHELYGVLRQLTGYRAAHVGWDPEGFADPEEIRTDYADELTAGDLPGLVLAEDIQRELRGSGFTAFAPGYVWIPYEGESASSATTD